jgi:hypothetical protein
MRRYLAAMTRYVEERAWRWALRAVQSPAALHGEDVAVPSSEDDQVCGCRLAVSVNVRDWECLRGSPAYVRIGGCALRRVGRWDRTSRGWVDAVGKGVTPFRGGHQVHGDNLALKGGFAEHAVALRPFRSHLPSAPIALVPSLILTRRAGPVGEHQREGEGAVTKCVSAPVRSIAGRWSDVGVTRR